ncbi:MAG: cell division protein FtsW [Oscillospiraceae bacterium]|nr:cell division protein FtsW [Oscillospiraceae bacterium]
MAWRSKRDMTREQQWAQGPLDMPFLMLTILLMTIGLLMLLSASSYAAGMEEVSNYDPAYYFKHQLSFAIAGTIIMYLVSRFDYQHLRWMSVPLLIVSIFMLIIVLLPIPLISVVRNNARRWLNLIFVQFQPSEIAKIAVVVFFSASLSKRPLTQLKAQKYAEKFPKRKPGQTNGTYLKDVYRWFSAKTGFGELIPYILVLGLIAFLLLLEPHMSGTLLIFAAAAAILFASGVHVGWFVAGGLGVALLFFLLVVVGGYNSSRLDVWQDPWSDPQDKGYQIIQSIYAVASGGLNGRGFGLSRQKYLYLPEEQNDFIFAIVCEELGFIGATLIIALFMMLILRGYYLALHARDRFGSLMVVGVTTLLAVQVFMNIAVVTNLIPATGISLPFFSYGGTALIIQMAEMGLILSVSRQIPGPKHD